MAASILGLLIASAAGADQNDPRLPGLFADLQAAPTSKAAAELEARIWSIWAETGNAELDKIYEIGNQALALGDLATSLKVFNSIVAQAPDFAEGWNKRATIQFMLGTTGTRSPTSTAPWRWSRIISARCPVLVWSTSSSTATRRRSTPSSASCA